MTEHYIQISVTKFKEILLNSWHLLPESKQFELMKMGLHKKSS